MSASQLISRTPRRAYIIAPSVKQKEEILKSIDRYCSLYYITMGSAYNIAQTAMIDALGAIKEDKKLYRQKTKQSINKALAAYNAWDAKMRFVLADRYQLWLDLSDASEAELKPLVKTLYYCIDNYFLKNHVPKSKIITSTDNLAMAKMLSTIAEKIPALPPTSHWASADTVATTKKLSHRPLSIKKTPGR